MIDQRAAESAALVAEELALTDRAAVLIGT
jgi:hypothetical protein